MDVNKPQGVHAVGDNPHRPPPERHRDQPAGDDGEKQPDAHDQAWSADTAVELASALAGEVTPEMQAMLSTFAAQVEPLREEIEIAHRREAHYRELAAAHPFLPVPNRREFLREVKHVIDHLGELHTPALLIAHVANAGDIRRRSGRRAADAALIQVAEALQGAAHPADAVGSLGGDDFGVIQLIGEGETADRRGGEIEAGVQGLRCDETPLQVLTGWVALNRSWSAEQAVEAADRQLRARLTL